MDGTGRIDLSGDDLLPVALKVSILLPFSVYVRGRGLKDFLAAISRPEARDAMMSQSVIRFWCFRGGIIGVFLHGAIMLFDFIS